MAARKRGRPKGSVNKKTVAKYNRLVKKYGKAAVDRKISEIQKRPKRKRGRPKGSTSSHRGPGRPRKVGRPKGSKNKHRGGKKSKTFHAHGVKVVVTTK